MQRQSTNLPIMYKWWKGKCGMLYKDLMFVKWKKSINCHFNYFPNIEHSCSHVGKYLSPLMVTFVKWNHDFNWLLIVNAMFYLVPITMSALQSSYLLVKTTLLMLLSEYSNLTYYVSLWFFTIKWPFCGLLLLCCELAAGY